jgi:hypothetical protein
MGLWNNIRRGWGKLSSHTKFDMGMDPKFVFGMMLGVGLNLSRHVFWTYLAFPILRMLWWWTIWSFLVSPISGVLTFLERLIIGRQIILPQSSLCCIPLEWKTGR